jgi:SAM-dependent methyltransferase
MNHKWYEDFFEGVVVDVWRQALSPEQTMLEVDFLERSLGFKPAARVFDVPCGMGRHSLELAARGFRMTGLDLSPEMMEQARANASARGLDIEWVNADMRALAPEPQFDAGFCLGNSFGYLEPQATRDFLKVVSRALKPGARFAMDYGMAAECILPRLRDREWMEIGDVLFLEENRYEVQESCVETTYTFVENGKRLTRTGLQWVYTVRELRRLLEEAGLHPEHLYRSFAGEPFAVGSPLLVLVAVKR